MRIIFAGTPDFAVAALQSLIDSHHEVCAVYTQPDRPSGRGRKLTASPVKQTALAHGLPVFQPVSLRDSEAQQQLSAVGADVMVVVAYGLILPEAVLGAPERGCINIHASLLPRWRGAAPIQRAIEAGDEKTGVTIMQMDKGLDTGDMLRWDECVIHQEDTSQVLHDRLALLGAESLIRVLEGIEQGSLCPVKQPEEGVSYAAKLTKHEALIDWKRPAVELQRSIRAFNPWPVSYTEWEGERLRVWEAKQYSGGATGAAGTVLAVVDDGLVVACGEGGLCITRAQLPGGRVRAINDLLNTRPELAQPGLVFSS